MGPTKIPYVDQTWDVTGGCHKRSPGCEHCWAVRSVHRLSSHPHGRRYRGLVNPAGTNWTGRVRWFADELLKPYQRQKPSFFFVNSKADLFDEQVLDAWLYAVFDIIARCRWHRFLVLTKEAERLVSFFPQYLAERRKSLQEFAHLCLGVSVEGPGQLDRYRMLLRMPAAVRAVSVEPLLESLSLQLEPDGENCLICGDTDHQLLECPHTHGARPNWVIIGCEKLPGQVPGRFCQDRMAWWAACRKLVSQCAFAGVPVWVKQGPVYLGRRHKTVVTANINEFPPDCRIQQLPQWRPR